MSDTISLDGGAPSTRSAAYTLDRRRVYIFPTRHGIMLGAMMLVILLGSINYDNALGYLLTFLLFGLYLIGMLHTYRNLVGLSYLGATSTPVFAGERALFSLTFDNRDLWPRYSTTLRRWIPLRGWRKRRRQSTYITYMPVIDTDGLCRIDLAVDSTQRGWLALERVMINSTYPLGILRAWAYFSEPSRCLIYPKPLGHLPLPYDGPANAPARTGKQRGDDDFSGFRPYRPGDPIRSIAWKSLARQDDVLVKRFTSGAAKKIQLRWADTAGLADTESRISQLTQWALDAERAGLHYGLEIAGTVFQPASGADHRHRVLRALALYET